jgi:hypothetical protein
MKNIQTIDGAENCTYDIFEATDEEFIILFPNATNITFSEDLCDANDNEILDGILKKIFSRLIKK